MQAESVKKKRYDRDFKISTVKMVTEGGHKATEVAKNGTESQMTILDSVRYYSPVLLINN